MNKIIFLSTRYFSKIDFFQYGVKEFIKKKVKVEIWYLNRIIKRNFKYNEKYEFKGVRTKQLYNILDLEKQLQRNILNCLYDSKLPYDLNSKKIYQLLSKYNANYLVRGKPLVYKLKNKEFNFNTFFKHKLSRIIKGKFFYLIKVIIKSFFLSLNPSIWRIKGATYVYLMGKNAYLNKNNHKLVQKKTLPIWGHHRNYDDYLKNNSKKIKTKKKVALFIDQGVPFHPGLIELGLSDQNPNIYYNSIRKFLKKIGDKFNYQIEISCHPKIKINKLKKYFPNYLIKYGDTINQIKSSSLVILHDSTARNFAVIYKKPILFITNDSLNNSVYTHYDEIKNTAKLFEQKPLNIDTCLIKDIKKNFKYNKKIYKNYFKNYIKFKGPNKPYSEIIIKKLKEDRVWI